MNDARSEDGRERPAPKVFHVKEATLFYSDHTSHSALHYEGGKVGGAWDPKIRELAAAVARQRCRDQLSEPPEEHQRECGHTERVEITDHDELPQRQFVCPDCGHEWSEEP